MIFLIFIFTMGKFYVIGIKNINVSNRYVFGGNCKTQKSDAKVDGQIDVNRQKIDRSYQISCSVVSDSF